MPLSPPYTRIVLYEGSGAQSLDSTERFRAIRSLLDGGLAVTRAGAERPLPPPDHATVVVVGWFKPPGPPPAECATNGAAIRWQSLGEDLTALPAEILALAETGAVPKSAPWTPWFPVIDGDRCTNCMQCLSFCLFGVYGVDEAKNIQVQNHDNCKTNCPACSRVCPEAAIIFPKYK
ncbi:MAG: 4Fe-4S dicluster domain-containing protein, partial [Limisphaerales bacterium]